MDLVVQLTTFVRAVELGSFTAAAEDLQLSGQLVGKHVQSLERHLGVSLLNRTTRKQSLTDFGRKYYEQAKIILAEVEISESMAAQTRGTPSGRLRINAPITFGSRTLSPKLADYMARFPDVTVDLTLSNRMADLVEEGYDVVFRVGELNDSGLIACSLGLYRLVLCAAPTYLKSRPLILSPWDLQKHECLRFEYPDGRSEWAFESTEGVINVPITSRLMVNHSEPLLGAALAGLGVMLQPLELVQDALESGQLVEVIPAFPPASPPLNLLYAKDRRITPKLRSFIEFCSATFGQNKGQA